MNALVIAVALVAQAGPVKGDVRELRTTLDGWVPAVRDKQSYDGFKRAVGRKNMAAIRRAFADDEVRFFQPGCKATIEALVPNDDPTDVHHLPGALVKVTGEVVGPQTQDGPGASPDDRYYVPLAYLRTDKETGDDKELRLPIFWVMADLAALPEQGRRMLLFDPKAKTVPFCEYETDCLEMLKLARAGDKVGLERMEANGRLGYTDNLTVALVLERHEAYRDDDPNVAEVRFITGRHKDKRRFVLESFTMVPTLVCLTEKQAQSQLGIKRGAAKKRK